MTDGIATGFQGIQQQDTRGGDTRAFEAAAKKAGGGKQAPVFERFPDKGIVKVHEGEKFVYDFKAKDPDGGEQTYELTHKADSEKFEIDRHTGVLTFKHAPDFEKPTDGNKDNVYDVEIKLVDDEGQTTQKTIWVKVQDKADDKADGGGKDNHAPHFTRFPDNGKITVHEGVEGEIYNFASSDKDGDKVTYSLGGVDGDKFRITEHNGRLSFKTAPDFEVPTDRNGDNTYDVDVILTDAHGATTKKTVWVMVQDKDEKPAGPEITNKAKDGIYHIDENKTFVTDFEAKGEDVRFSLNPTKADGEFFTIDEHTGELSFKNAPDFEKPLDGTKTPPDNIYDVEIIVTDKHGQTDKCDIWVKVKDVDEHVDEKPVFTNLPENGQLSIDENETFVIDVEGNDADGGEVTYSIVGGADGSKFTIDENTGKLSFKDAPDFEHPADGNKDNKYDVKIQIKDDEGTTCDKLLWVMVNDVDEKVDEKPVFEGLPDDGKIHINEGEVKVVDIDGNDPDGGKVEFSLLDKADSDKFEIDAHTGELTFKHAPDFESPTDGNKDNVYDVHVRITDDEGTTCDKTLWVKVKDVDETPPNEKPVFTNLPDDGKIHLDENQKHVIDIESRDPNGDDVTYSITGGRDADKFTIDAKTGELAFKEAPDFEHPASGGNDNTYDVKVTVSDGHESCDKMLWVKIKDVDETSPNSVDAVDDRGNTTEQGQPVSIDVTANDTDPEQDAFEVTQIAGQDAEVGVPVDVANGTATLQADGNITFAPDADFSGDTEFEYTITDAKGAVDTATVSVHVNERVDEKPVFTNLPDDGKIHIDEGEVKVVDIDGNDPDGGKVEFSLLDKADSDKFEIDAHTGELTFKHAPDFEHPTDGNKNNVYDVHVRITDDEGTTCDKTLWVKVKDVDEKSALTPTAGDDMVMTDENTAVTGDVKGNDTVEDGPGRYEATSQPANGELKFRHDGTFTYTPKDGFDGVDMFTYEVTDASGDKASATVMIVVKDTIADNRKPDAENDLVDTDENVAVAIDVLGNDTDPDGDDLTIVGTTDPANGSIEIVNGEIVYTPNDGFSGTDEFTYTISDGKLTDTATVKVCVKDTIADNKLPVARDDDAKTEFGTPVSIDAFANDFDPDGAGNAVFPGQIVDGPANGTVELVDGRFVYTPADGFAGTDRFTYTVVDDQGLESAPATVTVTVAKENLKPVAKDDKETVESGKTLHDTVADNDHLGDPENTFAIAMDAMNGTVTLREDGSYDYGSNDGFTGNDVFTYTITDGNGDTSTAKVAIHVTAADKAPKAVDDTNTVEVGGTAAGNVGDNDVAGDGDSRFELVDEPVNGTVEFNADGTYTYTPGDVVGNDTFTYRIIDADGDASEGRVTITVSEKDLRPDAVNDENETVQDTPVSGSVGDNDVRGNGENTFILAYPTVNGKLEFNADGTYTYTPNDGFVGNDRFSYILRDADGDENRAKVDIEVKAKPDTNTKVDAIDDANTTVEGTPVSGNVLTNDVDEDGDTLIAFLSERPQNGDVTIARDGSYTYTPADGFTGEDTFSYVAIDEDGNRDEATVTITVKDDGKQPPVAKRDTATTAPGQAVIVDVTANDDDPNGDNAALQVVQINDRPVSTGPGIVGPSVVVTNGVVTLLDDGTLSVEPNPGFEGGDIRFNYTVRDEEGLTDRASVTVHVGAGDERPDAMDDNFAIFAGETLNGDAGENDDRGDGVNTFALVEGSGPTDGTVTFNADGTFVYEPNDGFTGQDSFDYTITDEDGDVDTATVTVSVAGIVDDTPKDEKPVFENLPADGKIHVKEGEVAVVDIEGNDPDGGDVTYSIVGGRDAEFFAIDPVTGELTFKEARDFENPASGGGNNTYDVKVRITDDEGTTCDKALWVKIKDVDETPKPPANKPPVAVADSGTTDEGETVNIDVIGNDSDPDGDTISVTRIVTQPDNGVAVLREDGTVDYTPAAGFTGTDTFTYEIEDGNGGTDVAAVTVHVEEDDAPPPKSPVDKRPDAVNDAFDGVGGEPITGSVALNDDLGDTPSTFDTLTQPRNGTLTFNDDGSFVYTPNFGFNGTDSFVYTVTDADGDMDAAVVKLNVAKDTADIEPVARNDEFDVTPGTPVTDTVATNDELGNTPSVFMLVSDPVKGTLTFEDDGSFTYTANAGATGTDAFAYKITDADGDVSTAIVSLKLKDAPTPPPPPPADKKPDAVDDRFNGEFGQQITGFVFPNDTFGDGRNTFALVGQPDGGTVQLGETGFFRFRPDAGFSGDTSFDYRITDADGDTDVATVFIHVAKDKTPPPPPPPVDEKPVFTNLPDNGKIHIKEGEVDVIDIDGKDPDGGNVTYSIVGGADAGSFVIDAATGELTFKNATDFEHPGDRNKDNVYDVKVRVTDDEGTTCDKVLWVKVKDVDETPPPPANKEPDAVDDRFMGEFGKVIRGFVGRNDDMGDGPARFELISQPDGGQVSFGPRGGFAFTPNAGFSGVTTFDYRIIDANGDVDTATVTLTVKKDTTPQPPVDEKPVFTNLPGDGKIHIKEGEVDVIDIDGKDPDGGNVTYSIVGGADAGSFVIDATTGELTFKNATDFEHPGDRNKDNVYDVKVRVTDDEGTTCDKVLWVKVKDVADTKPPVANDDKAKTDQGDTVTINVLGNDTEPEGETIRVTGIATQPSNGTATVNADGTIDYTPNANFFGTDTFTYTIVDEDKLTDTATVTVTVDKDEPVNKPPHAVDDMKMGPAGHPLTVNVLANDKDPDGDVLKVTSVAGKPLPANGVVYLDNVTVKVNANGIFTFTPKPGFVGTASVDYHVSDHKGGTDEAHVVVQFKAPEPPANTPPHAVKDGYYLRPGLHYILPVLHNDKDADGDKLKIVQIDGHALKPGQSIRVEGGVVTLRYDGQIVFKGNRGTYGDFQFHYTIADGKGGYDTAPVYVCLTNGGRRH